MVFDNAYYWLREKISKTNPHINQVLTGGPYRSCYVEDALPEKSKLQKLPKTRKLPKKFYRPIDKNVTIPFGDWIVKRNIKCIKGGVLNITEGSTFRFTENAGVESTDGRIVIAGPNNLETIFTALDKEKGWGNLNLYAELNPNDGHSEPTIINNCLFEYINIPNNLRPRYQGAFVILGNASVILQNVRFENNSENQLTSTLCLDDYQSYSRSEYGLSKPQVTLINCSFINNMAETCCGGAIYCMDYDLKITGGQFFKNKASFGPAIYSRSSNVTLQDVTFEKNIVHIDDYYHPAIIETNTGHLKLKDCTFITEAENSYPLIGLDNKSTVTFTNCKQGTNRNNLEQLLEDKRNNLGRTTIWCSRKNKQFY